MQDSNLKDKWLEFFYNRIDSYESKINLLFTLITTTIISGLGVGYKLFETIDEYYDTIQGFDIKRKIAFIVFLIILSTFFGFMIKILMERYKINQKKKEKIEELITEIISNDEISNEGILHRWNVISNYNVKGLRK